MSFFRSGQTQTDLDRPGQTDPTQTNPDGPWQIWADPDGSRQTQMNLFCSLIEYLIERYWITNWWLKVPNLFGLVLYSNVNYHNGLLQEIHYIDY